MSLLLLRPLQLTDITHFQRWWNDPELRKLTSGSQAKVTPHDTARFVVDMLNSDGLHWMIVVGKRTIGHVTLERNGNTGEIRIMIGDKSYLGKGYGTRALRSVLKKARELGIQRAILGVRKDNVRAIRVYQKCGFLPSPKKKKHKIRDSKVLVMERML